MVANAEYARLSKILGQLPSDYWFAYEGIVYRYVNHRYCDDAIIANGVGAYNAGGRWNYQKVYHAVYCASTSLLAHEEYFQSTRLAGLDEFTVMPLTGKALRVKLNRVLDLRSAETLNILGLKEVNLMTDQWRELSDLGQESLCQAVGRAAFQYKCQALLVPSSVLQGPEHYNIVLMRENINEPTKIEIMK
ncbi:MAG: RES family NAD+ phosphorylase [Sumerlaeia bacterium]